MENTEMMPMSPKIKPGSPEKSNRTGLTKHAQGGAFVGVPVSDVPSAVSTDAEKVSTAAVAVVIEWIAPKKAAIPIRPWAVHLTTYF